MNVTWLGNDHVEYVSSPSGLLSLKIGSRTYDKEKLQELALPRLGLRAIFFPLFSRQKEPGSRYAMKKQKYQFRSALDIKAIDCVVLLS